MGARDISIIETPPEDRLPIRTEIVEYDEEVIVDAILREAEPWAGRHSSSTTAWRRSTSWPARLAELLPQVRIAVAHGQMGERELERVMLDFVAGATTSSSRP